MEGGWASLEVWAAAGRHPGDPTQSRGLHLQGGADVRSRAPHSPHPPDSRAMCMPGEHRRHPLYSSTRSHVAQGLTRSPRVTHHPARKGQALAGFSWLHRKCCPWPESGEGSPDMAPGGVPCPLAAQGPTCTTYPRQQHLDAARANVPGKPPDIIPLSLFLGHQTSLTSSSRPGMSPKAGGCPGGEGGLCWEPQEAMACQAGVPVARPQLCLGECVGLGLDRHRVAPRGGGWGRNVLGTQACGVLPGGGGCHMPCVHLCSLVVISGSVTLLAVMTAAAGRTLIRLRHRLLHS